MAGRTAGKRKPTSAEIATHNAAKHSKTAAEPSDSDESMGESDAEMEGGAEIESDAEIGDEPKLAGENGGKAGGTQGRARVTNADVMALNEASLLFKSNLFKLQIDELLGEVAVAANSKATQDVDAALQQIRAELLAMESTAELTMDAATNHVRKLSKAATGQVFGIPFPDPAPAAGLALRMASAAPDAVNVVGSYPLGMAVRSARGFTVDVLAQMPARLFQERDYLDYRYFYKRALFVALARVRLQGSAVGEMFDVEFALLRGDTRLPVVQLRPKRGARRLARLGCTIRILPSVGGDVLALRRLGPDSCNVRAALYSAAQGSVATPQYNAALAGDALQLTHLKYLHETQAACPAFARAAALLRVWLGQRTGARGAQQLLDSGRLGGFVVTVVLAWLVRSPGSGGVAGARLSGAMDALQLFKGAVEFLAERDFAAQPVRFGSADAFGGAGGAVLVDPSGRTNLLAGVAPWELLELRMLAQQTARDISHHSDSRFARVFLSGALADVATRYDHVLRVEADLGALLAARTGHVDAARRLRELEHGHPAAAARARIGELLARALAPRHARVVAVHAAADAAFAERTHVTRRHVFYVCVVAGAQAQRLVDLGPSPDAQPQDAAQFRALWGAKAELRRFRDGAIRLATVWGANAMPPEQRALILPRMLAFLLRRHFGVRAPPGLLADGDDDTSSTPDDDTSLTADDDTSSTPDAGRLFCASPRFAALASTRDLAESDAAHVTFEAARLALDQLQRDLRALEPQLPLRVLALHATAPGLRYASLAPPKPLAPGADDAYVEPLPVLVEFASSTKWPDDLAALHKVKSAFLLRLAACYGAAHPHALVDVASRHFGYGAADGLHTADHDCFVDIRLAPAGLTFRLRVLCEREGAMLARQAQAMEREQLAPQAEALRRQLRRWTRATQWRPQHHRRILDLCQRHHPAASLTIRLLKRWLARHLLLGAVPEETAELIAARVFTEPFAGLAAPASAYAGLVRCLRLLAEWRWQHDLCVVDFTAPDSNDDDDGPRAAGPRPVWAAADGLPADVYAAMQAAFDRAPAADALRLATADDPAAERWGAVSPLLTRRLRALASAALTAIVDCVGAGSDAALPQAFTTPMADYDFILKLDKRMVCRQHEQPPASALHGPEDAAPEPSKPEVFKNLRPAAARVKLHANPFGQPRMVGFDPVALLVRDLARVYGDSALFFHDVFGGRCIAGLWNPALAKPVPFNASANANVAPCPGEKANGRPAARFNKQAVLEEMARLGEGLVVDVVVQNE